MRSVAGVGRLRMRTTRTTVRSWKRRAAVGVATALVAGGLVPRAAHATSALVRWLPSDGNAAGYNVYARLAGTPYGAPQDVGAPRLEPNGTLTHTVRGLDSNRTYYFAVSAYGPGRDESPLSDELALGATDPCVVDHCSAPTACEFSPAPDGTSCLGSQLCGACLAGACSADAARLLGARRLQLSGDKRSVHLTAVARFAGGPPPGVELKLRLSNAAGTTLYQATVPSSALVASRTGRRFRLAEFTDVDASAPGLRTLTIRLRRRSVLVDLRVTDGKLLAALSETPLALAMTFGTGECLVERDLTCGSTASGLRLCH
jgi:hypothetical protein